LYYSIFTGPKSNQPSVIPLLPPPKKKTLAYAVSHQEARIFFSGLGNNNDENPMVTSVRIQDYLMGVAKTVTGFEGALLTPNGVRGGAPGAEGFEVF
jgi:hypothetical protein